MDKNKLNLPEHSPNENVWKIIEIGLSNQELLDAMPQHTPSEKVWNKIQPTPTGQVIILTNILKIAASFVFIIGVGYLIALLNPMKKDKEIINFTEEWIEPIDAKSWNIEEDRSIAALIEQKETERPLLLKSEEYNLLKREYKNLLDSKQQILNELNPYSENVELELILTRIELEKNSIARSLISFHAA